MLAIFIAAFMAAAAPSPLEMARDKQDRAALTEMAAQAGAAAAKAPNDAEAQYHAALANSYLAEVAIELRDRKAGRQTAEQGIKFAEKAVALKPANAEYYRILGTLYGQAVTDIMSGLSYGPKAKDAINKAVEKAPKSSMMYVARGVGNYYRPRPARRRRQALHTRFPEGHRTRSLQRRSLPLAGPQPAQRKSRRRGAPGLRQIPGTEPQPRLDQAAIGKDAGEMKPLATAAACAALALLDLLSVPRPHLAAAGQPDLRPHPRTPPRPRGLAQRHPGAAPPRRLYPLRRNRARPPRLTGAGLPRSARRPADRHPRPRHLGSLLMAEAARTRLRSLRCWSPRSVRSARSSPARPFSLSNTSPRRAPSPSRC